MQNKTFRDCNCGHTKDHHSTTREPHRCLNFDCGCKEYLPLGGIREEPIDMPEIKDISNKFRFEEGKEHGKKIWYVIEKFNSVIATCYSVEDAERITNLLNFIEKYKVIQQSGKKFFEPLLENK